MVAIFIIYLCALFGVIVAVGFILWDSRPVEERPYWCLRHLSPCLIQKAPTTALTHSAESRSVRSTGMAPPSPEMMLSGLTRDRVFGESQIAKSTISPAPAG